MKTKYFVLVKSVAVYDYETGAEIPLTAEQLRLAHHRYLDQNEGWAPLADLPSRKPSCVGNNPPVTKLFGYDAAKFMAKQYA